MKKNEYSWMSEEEVSFIKFLIVFFREIKIKNFNNPFLI